MLLAAVQEQAKQIAELKAQVAQLKARREERTKDQPGK
jgi:cell division protein FtsB